MRHNLPRGDFTMSRRTGLFVLLVWASIQFAAWAEVVRWEIRQRKPYADGKPRGAAGVYEEWTGVVHFAVDPENAANEQIVDLKLAPKNAAGKVEFSVDFRMLVPEERNKANGALFYEVNNRGNP